jgi:hypothetical protein
MNCFDFFRPYYRWENWFIVKRNSRWFIIKDNHCHHASFKTLKDAKNHVYFLHDPYMNLYDVMINSCEWEKLEATKEEIEQFANIMDAC